MPRETRRSLVAAGVAVLLALCAAGTASAQPKIKPQFQRHYDAGERAYRLGDYETARKEFEKARSVQDLPGTYRWLAAVAKEQGRFDDCLTEAVGYLKQAPGASWATTVRELHESCRRTLDRPRLVGDMGSGGAIAVTSNVEGATVRINGLKYGATPMAPRAVAVGKVDVELEAPRYLSRKQEVDILAGIVTDVHLDLEVDPNAPPDPGLGDPREEVEIGWVEFDVETPNATILFDGKTPEPDERGRIEYAPGVYNAVIEAPGYEPWKRRVRVVRGQERTLSVELRKQTAVERYQRLGYLSLGVAAVAAGAGFYFGLQEQDARELAQDIWDTETRRPPAVLGDFSDVVPVRTRDDLNAAVDDAKKWRTLEIVSYTAAAAALGAGLYFFLKQRPVEREGFPLPVAVTPLPDETGGVAGVGATFTTEVDW